MNILSLVGVTQHSAMRLHVIFNYYFLLYDIKIKLKMSGHENKLKHHFENKNKNS